MVLEIGTSETVPGDLSVYEKPLTREDVVAVREYLADPEQWAQSVSLEVRDNNKIARCLGGCLETVLYGTPRGIWMYPFKKVAIRQFAERGGLFFYDDGKNYPAANGAIVDYNDDEETDHADVIALLDKVIASFDMEQTSESTPEV